MDTEKRTRLKHAGYSSTTVQELFGLTDEENTLMEAQSAMDLFRQNLSKLIHDRRKDKFTQAQLSVLLKTSQPRIAMIESAHKSVTLDAMVRSALALGISRREIADAFRQSGRKTVTRRTQKKISSCAHRSSIIFHLIIDNLRNTLTDQNELRPNPSQIVAVEHYMPLASGRRRSSAGNDRG